MIIDKIPKLSPGNIWSGSKTLAVLTNPTDLAFKKRNLKHRYPIIYEGKKYGDVEDAFQRNKHFGMPLEARALLIVKLIKIKFKTYPFIFETIKFNGGIEWLNQCSHWTGSRNKTWEGDGVESLYLRCLMKAYTEYEKENLDESFM